MLCPRFFSLAPRFLPKQVTDYCAKGSLYDIIENEDIKLDNLFIASLINDLIKVRGVLSREVGSTEVSIVTGHDLHTRIEFGVPRQPQVIELRHHVSMDASNHRLRPA